MNFREQKIQATNTSTFRVSIIQIPILCPNCKAANNPVNHFIGNHGNIGAFYHHCTACNKDHFTIQEAEGSKSMVKTIYPNSLIASLPNLIKEKLPNGVNLYNQSFEAEQSGSLELAVIGYRAALETFIKDYALLSEQDDKDTIAKTNLAKSVKKYLPNMGTQNVADVIRIIGNDYAHWNSTNDVSFELFKQYVDIFIAQINMQLMMLFPPVSRN
ncbi:MAG: DUF4145 domain-containing protein [Lactobacillaceae bacterium]|jgi:hypothetical protein|nr:DUF4145 domain-containing protein [Lactobacillaceae bacterium]